MKKKEGSAPHFSEKSGTLHKSRTSLHAAQRYANAEEKKVRQAIFDDAEDSDYDRVELFSGREDTRASQLLGGGLQLTNTNAASFLRQAINQTVPNKSPEETKNEPTSAKSSEMAPQEFMNSEIDKVSEMDQFRNSLTSLEDQQVAAIPNPFRTGDLVVKKQPSAFKYVERAIPLVTFNPGKQCFVVNPEAVQMMETVKGPLGVVSVAGMYRTGKSYLLNRVLLNRQRGFGVGPTINPCTKGIWLWGTPLCGTSQSGDPINIIIVDSEGLGGIDEDNNHDMRIFSLAMLMSSYFVYNSMGQIDENAISNLSLVINLTKHIQLSVQKDTDSSLDTVLPSFMWVVRDFSLQLEDEEGNEITQNDYLEKALSQQSSDPTDPKTQIRKCLIKYFPKRDCHTLVRPLVDEDKLQKLEEMEIDQLRAEFVEQVMNLRRKILNNCPVKQVYGHAMDGETWISLLGLYVNAINNGTVPNIESAWTQICRNKAQAALSAVVDQFEKEIAELGNPVSQSEYEKSLQDAERTAVKDLKKEMTSDEQIANEFVSKLKQHLGKRTKDLVAQNHQFCIEFAQQMIAQLFTEIDQIKQTCQEDPCSNSFQQVEYALREVTNYYDSNCCDFAEKHLYLSEAKLAFTFEILAIQSHHAIKQSRFQREMETETLERHNQQLRVCKEEARTEQVRLEQQWKLALQQKSELEAGQQIMSEQLKTLKELKAKEEADHNDVHNKLKKQMQELKDEFQSKKDKYDEQAKEIARNQKQAVSEFEKEKALMKQKIDHLEKTLEEKNNREREYAVDWRTQKTGVAQEIKAVTAKHEAEMKILLQQIDEEKDHSSELESKLADKSQKLEAMQERLSDIESSYKHQLADAQTTIKGLMESKNQIKQETMNQLSSKLQQSQLEHQLQKQVIDELEKKLKEGSEQLLTATHESRKQVAMRDQKIEFLDMQLKDIKEQMEETQRQHAQMVKTLNSRNATSDDESDAKERIELLNKELAATNEIHSKQVKDLQAEIANQKKKLATQETVAKEKLAENQALLQDAQTQLKEFEQKTDDLKERLRQLELTRSKLTDEQKTQEQAFKARLEQEITDHEEMYRTEIKEMQTRHDEQITQLKQFYELEKEKIELRINEEKERSQRKLASLQEEQEARFREEFRDKDSEIDYLNQQLQEMEQHQQSFSTQAEHEISLKQMQIEGLERQTADLKERLNKVEQTRNSAFDKQLENFEQQRQELNARVDRLMKDNLAKDKQIATMTNQMERATEAMSKRDGEYDQTRAQLERDRQILAERCEQQKIALSELQDEAMQGNLESGREIALLTQQVEFLNQKIDDLQKSSEENQRMFEDKIKIIRQEILEDSQAQVDRVTQEKELWEQKYEQKRKALKDIEVTLGRKITELEKQSGVQQSQIHKLELERQTKELSHAEEISRLQQRLVSNDSQNQQQLYGTVTTEELLVMKNQLNEAERELQDLQSTYDRDKALWEGKVQFLEQQKDNYKKDLLESQRKFEITLDQLQKRGTATKERQEGQQQTILKVLESKYKAQIKEMLESQQATVNEQKDRCKKLEAELAAANEKINFQGRSKGDEVGQLEKKLQEYKQNESRLQSALADLQAESQKKLDDLDAQLRRDKDLFKTRLMDAEKKAKDAESKRAQMLFSIEKERANWQLEEDHLRRKQAEMEEFIQNLEKSKEILKKENSKLRSDVRGNSAAGQKKQFVFNKAATHLLNQTAQSMSSQLPIKPSVNRSGSFTVQQDQVSAGIDTNNSTNGISQGSILNTAITRLKENQDNSYVELTKSITSMDGKQRQMASPDLKRMTQKSPLLVNRSGQQIKASIPPRQPLISGSLSSYNTTTQPQDNLSNNGSAAGQGFKLNLPNRYSSQEHKTNE